MEKFAALDTFPNVLQNRSFTNPVALDNQGNKVDIRGKCRETMFQNGGPITLELACGKGEYTNAMAQKFPDRNFIGIDLKGNRLHNGAEQAIQNKLTNAAFLRTEIYLLPDFFSEEEVSEIWIIFPDPKLRPSKSQQRLTSERFIETYRKVMPKGGIINLKTDDPTLYEFTLESVTNANANLIYHNNDIYSAPLYDPLLDVKTFYEKRHLKNNKKIKYVKFSI